MRMVRLVVKPSLREASCCRVEVVKGAAGLRRRCFFSTLTTLRVPPAASSRVFSASRACFSSVMVNCSTLSPR